jgi:Xaa-Pro aminopeptidase
MADRRFGALIATSPENVTWSAAYTSWTIYTFKDLEVYAVTPCTGETALVVPIDALDYIAQRPPNTTNVYTYGTFFTVTFPGATLQGAEARVIELRAQSSHHASAAEALKQALVDQGVTGGTIGLDERGVPPSRWRSLQEALSPMQLVAANDIFRKLRTIKTDEEIELLRHAAQAVEMGMIEMFANATPGLTEADLETRFRTTVAAAGVTPGHFETSAGTRGAGCFPASSEYTIHMGDVIRSDCGGRYFGYWADTGRTAVVGEAPAILLRYYDALRDGIEAMLKVIRPGLRVSDLFDVGVGTVQQTIPHYRRHHVGHGIGLEMYEAPLLVGADGKTDIHNIGRADTVLEEGMVINIELPYYEFGLGGLQIEDTLVVRSTGPELLTKASRDLYRSPFHA